MPAGLDLDFLDSTLQGRGSELAESKTRQDVHFSLIPSTFQHAHLGLNAMKRAEAAGKIKFVSGEWPTGTFRLVPTTAENTAEDAVPAAMSGGATTEKTSKAIRLAQPKASATDPATNRKVAKLEKKLKVLRQLHSGYHKDDQARIRNLLAQVPKTKVKQVEKQFKELEQQNGDFHKAQQHKIDNLLEKIQKLSS